jgi:hypothetical protein
MATKFCTIHDYRSFPRLSYINHDLSTLASMCTFDTRDDSSMVGGKMTAVPRLASLFQLISHLRPTRSESPTKDVDAK